MSRKKENITFKQLKSYDKKHDRDLTLIFLKPSTLTIKTQSGLGKFNSLLNGPSLQLTTRKFKTVAGKIEPEEEEEEEKEDDDGLLYDNNLYDDETDDETDDDIEESDQNDNGDQVEMYSNSFNITPNKHINLDSLLSYLSEVTSLKKYVKEKVFFKNEYLVKFSVNIELKTPLSYEKFSQLIKNICLLLSHKMCKKFIVEIPFHIINRLMKYLKDNQMLSTYYKISPNRFSIGTMINLSKFITHFKSPKSSENPDLPMLLELKFHGRGMTIYFHLDSIYRVYKMFYGFASFRTIVFEQNEEFDRIYVECTKVPLLYYADLEAKDREMLLELDISDVRLDWKRTLKLQYTGKLSKSQNSLDQNLLAMSNALFIEVPFQEKDPFLEKLIHMVYKCRECNKAFQFYVSTLKHINCKNFNYNDLNMLLDQKKFPFSIHFACLVLFSSSYKTMDSLIEENSLKEFLNLVKSETVKSRNIEQLGYLERCIYFLKVHCREQIIINVFHHFSSILKTKMDLKAEELHEDYVLIRKASLYPSHIELEQPVALLKSRFSNLANLEYAMRITVYDNGGRMLNMCNDRSENELIFGIIKRHLLEGIPIGDRVYEFLGSSTSQMRDFGCTLYAQDPNERNADDIRNAAGELSVFNRSVPKYIARFGLVFSQSMTLINIGDDVIIRTVRDIMGAVKPDCRNYVNFKKETYIMSDGVGMVSKSVAKTFIPYLDVKGDYFPSAYQIRYGGCKGMLTVWEMEEHSIIFRDSMRKYESNSRLLGILKYSWPRWVYLNRPLICILDHLNVDRNQFYNYFYQSTSSVAKATLYDSCAMDLIRIYATGILPYDHINNSGISLLDEPFLRSIINYLIYYRLNFELKWKARIRVPNNIGRIAFGVIDESGILEYGQVYFQYSKMKEDGSCLPETIVLEGDVMITKFPCLQPGDVRKFKAVNVKQLSHIKDCLVFPQKGHRPHPDEMGGSDLDGDEYAIFWDKKFFFNGPNRKPMDFPYGLSKSLSYDITVEDLVEFFCHYLIKTNIGMVANTHLLFADFHHEGLDSEECEDLAFSYNISLDFPKTGFIEYSPRKYTINLRPDFMARRENHKIYLSKKILGQYYRHCALVEKSIELSQYDYRFSLLNSSTKSRNHQQQFLKVKSLIKNRLILADWKKFYNEAEEAFAEYKMQVIDIMAKLEVENEVMLFADVYEDKKDVCKNLLKQLFDYFKSKFRKQCELKKCYNTVDRYFLASSWYAICYEKRYIHNGKLLLGLPWIISEEMCQLAQFSFSGKIATQQRLSQNLRTMIIDGEKFTFSIGVNHKEVVPYNFENGIIYGMLFDYEKHKIYETQVIYFYWSSIETIQLFTKHHSHLLPIYYEVLVKTQLTIVEDLVMNWIYAIKKRIYFDFDDNRIIHIFENGENENRKCTSIKESELLRKIVKESFRKILKQSGHKPNPYGQSLSTISTLFNQFMFFLFEICSQVNSTIYDGKIEDLFMLKYAIFALSFIDKLDSKLDRRIYVDFSFKIRSQMNKTIEALIAYKNHPSFAIDHFIDLFNDSYAYQKHLDSLFDTFLADNSCLVMETSSFSLLPSSNRVELKDFESVVFHRLFFLSNVKFIDVSLSQDDPMPYAKEENNSNKNSDRSESEDSEARVSNDHNKTKFVRPSFKRRALPTTLKKTLNKIENENQQPDSNEKDEVSQQALSDFMASAHYLIKTTGLSHTILILRILLGHPDFFNNVCYHFDVTSNYDN